MIRKTHFPLAAEKLRHRAEERLRVQTLLGKVPQSEIDSQRLLHELQVHMIELEMQNEAYRDALTRAEAGRHFSKLYEHAPVAYLTVDHDSSIVSLNLAASRLLGLTRAQLKGQRLASYLDGPSSAQLPAFLARVFTGQGVASATVKLIPGADASDGNELQIDAVADEDGLLCHLAATDISTLKRSEQALRESRDELRRAQQLAHLGSWRVAADGAAFSGSEELSRIFGLPAEQPLSFAHFVACVHPDDRQAVGQERELSAKGGSYDIEYRIVVGGAVRWLRERATFTTDGNGRCRGLGSTEDISERKRLEVEVYRLAFHDPLTGLPNRRLLGDRLQQAMAASKRSGCYAALMFIDLDHFKSLNDHHGHHVGDRLLVEVASRLVACVRESDTVARFAGDEFVVVLGELAADERESALEADRVAAKIRLALCEPYALGITEDGATTLQRCTASIGLALFHGAQANGDELLHWADQAMFLAKAAGGNRCCVR